MILFINAVVTSRYYDTGVNLKVKKTRGAYSGIRE
jgi:hypothetical protein